jgi:stringent starvation protein B
MIAEPEQPASISTRKQLLELERRSITEAVHPSTISGVELIGTQSTEFNALVTEIVGADRPNGLLACLPYGVLIENRTSQALAAINIVWTADGQTKPVLLNAAEQRFTAPGQFVKPGQAVLAVPSGNLESPRNLRIFADGSTFGHRLENFDRAEKVVVAVDAVVYASGQFVGADTYGAYERWQAEINAPRTLAAAVLQKKKTQSIGEIVSWIENLAATRRASDVNAQETVLATRVLLAAYRNKGNQSFTHAPNARPNNPRFRCTGRVAACPAADRFGSSRAVAWRFENRPPSSSSSPRGK